MNTSQRMSSLKKFWNCIRNKLRKRTKRPIQQNIINGCLTTNEESIQQNINTINTSIENTATDYLFLRYDNEITSFYCHDLKLKVIVSYSSSFLYFGSSYCLTVYSSTLMTYYYHKKSITVTIDLINYCLSNRSPHLSLDLNALDQSF
jgi:hypothetical protein